jgi:hypothetical protein
MAAPRDIECALFNDSRIRNKKKTDVAAEFNRTTTTITILRKKIRTTCDFE